MTDMNMEAHSSKKKYLIPLVALLICGMSLTGAAYAYSASLTSTDDLAVKSYEITVNGQDVIVLDDLYLQFDSDKVDGKVVYTAENFSKDIKVAMAEKNNTAKFKVTSASVVVDKCPNGLVFSIDPKTTDAVENTTLTLTASGTLDEDVVPEASYKVKIIIETEAA